MPLPVSLLRKESTSHSVHRYVYPLSLTSNSYPPPPPLQHALRLIAFRKAHLVLGVDPLAPPGARKDPPPPEGDNPPAEKEGDAGETAEAPEAKRPRVADQQQP